MIWNYLSIPDLVYASTEPAGSVRGATPGPDFAQPRWIFFRPSGRKPGYVKVESTEGRSMARSVPFHYRLMVAVVLLTAFAFFWGLREFQRLSVVSPHPSLPRCTRQRKNTIFGLPCDFVGSRVPPLGVRRLCHEPVRFCRPGSHLFAALADNCQGWTPPIRGGPAPLWRSCFCSPWHGCVRREADGSFGSFWCFAVRQPWSSRPYVPITILSSLCSC